MSQDISDSSNQHNKETSHEAGLASEHDTHGEAHENHEHTLYSEPVFNIGSLEVTNSLLTSWVAVFLILIIASCTFGAIYLFTFIK